MLEHLSFFNKIINKLLAIDVKIDEENKELILLYSLPRSYDHIVTTMFQGKETLILEEVMSTFLSNESRKMPNQGSRQHRVWWSREGKEEEKERKVRTRQRRVTFITGKIIRRMTANIRKSG